MKKKSKATALAFFAVLLSPMALFLPFHAHALTITPIDSDFDGFGGYPGWDFGAVTVGETAVLGVFFAVECTSADVLYFISDAAVDPFFDFNGDLTLSSGRLGDEPDSSRPRGGTSRPRDVRGLNFHRTKLDAMMSDTRYCNSDVVLWQTAF